MNKHLIALVAAAGLGAFGAAAYADDASHQADKQNTAQYKADKKKAEANEDLNKAKCGSSLTEAGRACKSDASAQAKKDKADAKVNEVNGKEANK
jgi:hypothetical protein